MAKSSKRSTPKSASASKSASSKAQSAGKRNPAARATSTKTPRANIAAIQRQIDDVDRQILKLVEQRCSIVRELAQTDQAGIVVRMSDATSHAHEMVEKAAKLNDQISVDQKQSLLKHVASLCLGTLHRLNVSFLGPQHSYSHLAAIKYFGEGASFSPVTSIAAVFDAVTRNEAVAGIVPIENSTDGRVVDTLSMFVRRKMQVCGEVLLPIHHNLLSRTSRDQIVEVYSKPQALSQCRGWLSNHLPHAKLVDMSSTTAAARIAAEKVGAAAVASIEAGREYNLDVIDANIEDNPNNVTRFAVLGREQSPPTGDDKTAILFQVNHQPGALADAMTVFKKANLNLTFIESFPIPERRNEYVFFIELTGHQADKNVTDAIKVLGKQTQRLDLLGSYPRAEL